MFDANANATLSSQLVPIDPNNDKQASYGFAPHNEASYDVATNTFNISQNINKYIVISFTDPTQTQAAPLGGLTYSCSCRTPMKDPPATPAPDCTPSAQKSGDDCYCMACTVNASCSECGHLTTSRGVILNNMNVSLVIKVNSLNYQ